MGEERVPGGNPKYPLFWVSQFSVKHPQDNFSLQNAKLTPSKIYIGEGRFLRDSIQKMQVGDHQSLFGGCHFTFWRVPILFWRLKLSWGRFTETGVNPTRVVLWVRVSTRSGHEASQARQGDLGPFTAASSARLRL